MKEKMKANEILFFISYAIILISSMLNCIYGISNILNVLDNFALVMLCINCLFNIDKTSIKKIFILSFIIVIAIISAYISKDKSILKIILLIISCKNINFNKVVKFDLYLKLINLILVLICYKLGVTRNYFMFRLDGTVRSSMGFVHPNVFASFIMSIVIEYLYLKKQKINIWEFIGILIIVYIVDLCSNSKTSEVCLILMLFYKVYVDFIKSRIQKNNFVRFKKKMCVNHFFLIMSVLSFFLGYLYSNHSIIATKINEITTGRISLIYQFFNKYDITLFGNNIEIVGTHASHLTNQKSWILDNAYSLLLLRYGILMFIIIVVCMYIFMKDLTENKYQKMQMAMIIFLIYGLMETGLYKIEFNVFLLYFSKILYCKEGEKIV